MTQPLDFSGAGRKQAAPPLPPRQPPGARRARSLTLAVGVLVVAAVLAVVAFDLYRSDSGSDADVARYCRLSGELDEVSARTGAASAPAAYDGTPEQIKAAVAEMGKGLGELRTVAPKAVRADVGVVTDALERAAAGNANAVKEPGFTASALRASLDRSTNCGGGSGGD